MVKDVTTAGYEHQDFPFEQLVARLDPDRDMSRNPLFQVMVVYQEERESDTFSLPGMEVETVEMDYDLSKFDLSFEFAPGVMS